MLRLAMILYSLSGATLAGTAVIIALVAGYDDLRGILIAAALGALVGIPVAIGVARKLVAS